MKSTEIKENKTVKKITKTEESKELKPQIISDNIQNDEIFIETKGVIKLKPTKLKYFKDGSYNNFMLIKTMGVHEVLKYEDGEDLIKKFIAAVLDVKSETIDFIDEMSTKTLFDLIEKMNKINEIKDTDFFTQNQITEVITEE